MCDGGIDFVPDLGFLRANGYREISYTQGVHRLFAVCIQ